MRASIHSWHLPPVACSAILAALGLYGPPLLHGEPIPDQEIPATLESLVQHNKRTWSALRTWRGTFQVDDVELLRGVRASTFLEAHKLDLDTPSPEIEKLNHAVVTFARDFKADRLYSNFHTLDVNASVPGSSQPINVRLAPFRQCSIVTPEHLLQLEPDVKFAGASGPDQPARTTAFKRPRVEAQGQEWGTIVDPRTLFGYPRPAWQELSTILSALQQIRRVEVDGHALTVSQSGEGEELEYQVVLPGRTTSGTYLFQEMTFRADAGLNICRFAMHDSAGAVRQEIEWEYTQQEGLFLPSWVRYRSLHPDDQRVTFQRTLTLVESEINVVLPAETFSIRGLGLADGDRFVDKGTGKVSTYEGGKLREQAAEPIPGGAPGSMPIDAPGS